MALLTIKLEASGDGNASLEQLSEALATLKTLLADADRAVSRKRRITYKVDKIVHESNYDVYVITDEEELAGAEPTAGVSKLGEAITEFRERKQIPKGYDGRGLSNFSKLRELEGKFDRISIPVDGGYVPFTPQIHSEISRVIESVEPDESCWGSLRGKMLKWDGEETVNTFHIFPDYGPTKVRCTFSDNTRAQVTAGVDKYVEVYGRMVYKPKAENPYRMEAESVTPIGDKIDVELLRRLKDSSPNATGDVSAEDFIKDLRNG